MPVVTITWTDEEKAKLNAKGDEKGYAKCPVCGDSMAWKLFHATPYEEGVIVLVNSSSRPNEEPVRMSGVKSLSVLCEECFKTTSPESRVEFYSKHLASRKTRIKSVLRLRDGTEGGFRESKRDRERYDMEASEIEREVELIMNAAREGK